MLIVDVSMRKHNELYFIPEPPHEKRLKEKFKLAAGFKIFSAGLGNKPFISFIHA